MEEFQGVKIGDLIEVFDGIYIGKQGFVKDIDVVGEFKGNHKEAVVYFRCAPKLVFGKDSKMETKMFDVKAGEFTKLNQEVKP
jgi:hypothetical protein